LSFVLINTPPSTDETGKRPKKIRLVQTTKNKTKQNKTNHLKTTTKTISTPKKKNNKQTYQQQKIFKSPTLHDLTTTIRLISFHI